MTNNLKELQEKYEDLQGLARFYLNEANYYHEKATWWRKQSDEDEAEREKLVDIMCKIYELACHESKETIDDLAEKLDQIKELTKKA